MASRIEIKENNLNKIWQEYKDGKNYLRSMGLDTTIPMCVDFYEGRHWGKISEKTIFYLMTRGLSEEEAKAMIVRGFAYLIK